jgi:hypothetical protein
MRVLVDGIGGASLGIEVLKSLPLAGKYAVYCCAIWPLAIGHYQRGHVGTFVIDRINYVAGVFKICWPGCIYYNLLPGMRAQWAIPLLKKFYELFHKQPVFRQVFGII